MTNSFCAFESGVRENCIRLVSWLTANLTCRSHSSVNFHPILKIKVSEFKLQFYLSNNVSFIDIMFSKPSYSCLKLFPFFWDTLYTISLNAEQFLGDLRGKFSRERSGQSVSLLNHLKQGRLPLNLL